MAHPIYFGWCPQPGDQVELKQMTAITLSLVEHPSLRDLLLSSESQTSLDELLEIISTKVSVILSIDVVEEHLNMYK
jgi:hypothetical protein